MDGQSPHKAERLEDQLRRMIVTGSVPPLANNSSPTHPLVVRLPPHSPSPLLSHSQQSQSSTQDQIVYDRNIEYATVSMGPLPDSYNRRGRSARRVPPPVCHHGNGRRPGHYDPPNVFRQPGIETDNAQTSLHGFGPGSGPGPVPGPGHGHQRARYQQQVALDPNAFQRNGPDSMFYQGNHNAHQLFNPNHRGMHPFSSPSWRERQSFYLENLAQIQTRDVDMLREEHDEKEAFRARLQEILTDVCASNSERFPQVSLECFGSFKSGLATRGSDMDLVIVIDDHEPSAVVFSPSGDDLPRLLEKCLLDLGIGARLLSKTRVPIIKVCERPGEEFLGRLRQEREKWDLLSDEEKNPHLYPNQDLERAPVGQPEEPTGDGSADGQQPETNTDPENRASALSDRLVEIVETRDTPIETQAAKITLNANGNPKNNNQGNAHRDAAKTWTRERKAGPLDFPKKDVGILCDINFYNPLGLHNTQMLRCYSLADHRVRPMILFVKAWAGRRKINSSYSGTLSSYGYVLMVLHYLINVASPPVLPNLQSPWRPSPDCIPGYTEEVNGWAVSFWRDESEISNAAKNGQLGQNRESLGSLLAGFFNFYSSQNHGSQFHWMQEVLSLRSPGGILSKVEKGWTKATTEETEGRKVQQRYLFCIEDPFELNHNVARTVSHYGIVAIRDEFRRARRILQAVGDGGVPRDGELFDDLVEPDEEADTTDGPTGGPPNGVANGAANATANGAVPANNYSATAANVVPNPTLKTASSNALPPKPTQPAQTVPRGGKFRGANASTNTNSNVTRNSMTMSATNPPSLNVQDNAAFPSLGAPAPEQHGRGRGGGRGRGRGRGASRGRGSAANRGGGTTGNIETGPQVETTNMEAVDNVSDQSALRGRGGRGGRRADGRGHGRAGRWGRGRGGHASGVAIDDAEVKRMNDEAHAESTAYGAAEAVLDDS